MDETKKSQIEKSCSLFSSAVLTFWVGRFNFLGLGRFKVGQMDELGEDKQNGDTQVKARSTKERS